MWIGLFSLGYEMFVIGVHRPCGHDNEGTAADENLLQHRRLLHNSYTPTHYRGACSTNRDILPQLKQWTSQLCLSVRLCYQQGSPTEIGLTAPPAKVDVPTL